MPLRPKRRSGFQLVRGGTVVRDYLRGYWRLDLRIVEKI